MYPYDVSPLEEIRSEMKNNSLNVFIDIEFPPQEKSIYEPSAGKPYGDVIQWKRPKDFMTVNEALNLHPISVFEKDIEPNDIK